VDNDRLYEALQEIKQDVAVIKSEFASLKNVVPKVEGLEKKLIEQEATISQLKSVNNKMWGVISGVLVATIAALIKTFMGV
jgi:hypothetical protein